jgi:hypothetical protein
MAAAVLLGLIPGVGAMYNGQYAKALAHVVIFAILVSLAANASAIFLIFIFAWVAYMVFDSYHTARARRDGTPLPNAFGLNDAASWFQGPRSRFTAAYYGDANRPSPFASSFTSTPPPPQQPYGGGYYAPPIPPVPPVPPVDPAFGQTCSKGPTGAIVLIALGVIFLLSTFGVLNDRWLAHGWPLILIGMGLFMLVRRLQPRGNGRGGM